MLDPKLVREEPDRVRGMLRDRNMDAGHVDAFLAVDEQWRVEAHELDDLRSLLNTLSKQRNVEEAKVVKASIKTRDESVRSLEKQRQETLFAIPNLLLDDVPRGPDAAANVVLREWGKKPQFDFEAKDHIALGEALDIIDIKRAAKVSGGRFAFLKGAAAQLEFALINFTLEVLTSEKILKKLAKPIGCSAKPFVPVVPPAMITPEAFTRMARLSSEDRDERYHLEKDDLYLIGSGEHPIGAMHMDEKLALADLPMRYVGISPCFRREAGSYGQDTRGILRVHQFDKIEMESFSAPEEGLREHKFMVAIQEYLIQQIGLPYRTMLLSSGDMGKPDTRQIDIEVWIPSQKRYRETHSADYVSDYQSRRLSTKTTTRSDGTTFVHMNDATAFAIGRTLIAILENNQTAAGTVRIPKVLQRYTGFSLIS